MNIKNIWNLLVDSVRGKEYDYTKGNLKKAIFLLSIPMILELSMESIFAVVDMFFVGKLGSNAIAAVGYTEALTTIIYSVGIGLSTAATALIARRVGEKNNTEASNTAIQALFISLFVAIILSILGISFSNELLLFMGGTPEVIEEGSTYTKIIFASSPIIILLFLINGMFRGAGNASLAFKSLFLASIVNIILDPILIYGIGSWPGLGLKGAAIATCIGRGSGVLYQCYHLFYGTGLLKLTIKKLNIDYEVIVSMIKLAWPATFQFVIASGSWIVLTKLVADTGGPEASAGYQIAIRNVVFFILPAWGLSNAAATLVGQNLGAGEIDRAEKSVILATKMNAVFMTFVMMLFILVAEPIIRIFTTEPEVIKIGIDALRIMGSGFIFYGIGMVMMQALNGAGDTVTPTWINFIGFWLFQIPIGYLMVYIFGWGLTGAFAAVPIAETLIAITAWYFFKKGRWKKIKI